MMSCLPLASYNLIVSPGESVQAIEDDFPISVCITMAALDPVKINNNDKSSETSTLRIKKISNFNNQLDADLESEVSDNEDQNEENPSLKSSIENKSKKDKNMDDDVNVEEYVICTLSPKTSYQQLLNFVITSGESAFFEVTGPYAIHLSGNYIEHPFDEDESDINSLDEDEDEDELDDGDYDLSPDEDELVPRVEELDDDGEKDDIDKHTDDDEDEQDDEQDEEQDDEQEDGDDEDEDEEEDDEDDEMDEDEIDEMDEDDRKVEKKKSLDKEKGKKHNEPIDKKTSTFKRNAEEEKSNLSKKTKVDKTVAFKKDLEQGPTPSEPKILKIKTLEGGVKIEDRVIGEGPYAKAGSKVTVRYVGKLKTGKIFDSNTKGKPFYFSVSKGEVIRGWDIGIQGMRVKGERRIHIPAAMAYGNQKLPGIPPNSDLTFDVKVLKIN